jgi:hypothetical protein
VSQSIFKTFFEKYGQLVACTANENALRNFLLDQGEMITFANLEWAAQQLAAEGKLAIEAERIPSEAEQAANADRERLAEARRLKSLDADALRKEVRKAQRQQTKQQAEGAHQLLKLSNEELRQRVRHQFQRPAQVEQELPPEWTKTTLFQASSEQLRELIRKFGTSAVNRALAERV